MVCHLYTGCCKYFTATDLSNCSRRAEYMYWCKAPLSIRLLNHFTRGGSITQNIQWMSMPLAVDDDHHAASLLSARCVACLTLREPLNPLSMYLGIDLVNQEPNMILAPERSTEITANLYFFNCIQPPVNRAADACHIHRHQLIRQINKYIYIYIWECTECGRSCVRIQVKYSQ